MRHERRIGHGDPVAPRRQLRRIPPQLLVRGVELRAIRLAQLVDVAHAELVGHQADRRVLAERLAGRALGGDQDQVFAADPSVSLGHTDLSGSVASPSMPQDVAADERVRVTHRVACKHVRLGVTPSQRRPGARASEARDVASRSTDGRVVRLRGRARSLLDRGP
jgi:hypothetical protein